jgi:hypothetical protein
VAWVSNPMGSIHRGLRFSVHNVTQKELNSQLDMFTYDMIVNTWYSKIRKIQAEPFIHTLL